jgi:hypothetical protein
LLILLTWENFLSGEHCITHAKHIVSMEFQLLMFERQFFVTLKCDFVRIRQSDQGSTWGSTCSNIRATIRINFFLFILRLLTSPEFI